MKNTQTLTLLLTVSMLIAVNSHANNDFRYSKTQKFLGSQCQVLNKNLDDIDYRIDPILGTLANYSNRNLYVLCPIGKPTYSSRSGGIETASITVKNPSFIPFSCSLYQVNHDVSPATTERQIMSSSRRSSETETLKYRVNSSAFAPDTLHFYCRIPRSIGNYGPALIASYEIQLKDT